MSFNESLGVVVVGRGGDDDDDDRGSLALERGNRSDRLLR
jgi:hypothetical protein